MSSCLTIYDRRGIRFFTLTYNPTPERTNTRSDRP